MGRKKRRVYIHYGASRFEPSEFGPIRNYPVTGVKPVHNTGLWASPVKSKYGWVDWCNQEEFNLDRLSTSFKFILKPGAKVAHIRNRNDLYKLPSRSNDFCYSIDFEAAAKRYDAIELHLTEDPYGVRGDLYYLLYGWDCDSILILNKDIVEEVRE